MGHGLDLREFQGQSRPPTGMNSFAVMYASLDLLEGLVQTAEWTCGNGEIDIYIVDQKWGVKFLRDGDRLESG
jgi:hypothetical protein